MTTEGCCSLGVDCGGFSGTQHSELKRRSLKSQELSKAVSSVEYHEGRQEALKRGGNTKNLAASKKTTIIDFVKYLIENRISADSFFPFVMIIALFVILTLGLGGGWCIIGAINGMTDGRSEVFGLDSYEDSIFMALQVLSFGEWQEDIPKGKGLRFWYYFEVITGLVTFAILIGFISDSVKSYMANLQSGSTTVLEENHTLILGWNESTARVVVQTAFLRRQFQMLNEEKYPILKRLPLLRIIMGYFGILERPSTSMANGDIVILTDNMTKDEMHTALSHTLDERGVIPGRTKLGQNIVCRVGSPSNVNDLIRVGAHKASAILVQVTAEDLVEEDLSGGNIKNGATVRVALAVRNCVLANAPDGVINSDLRIVLQMSNPSQFVDAACFKHANGGDVVIPMDLSVFLNTLLFKSAATPGLAKVLLEIFDFEGVAIRRRKARNLVGGPDNEYGHCCGFGSNGQRQSFREMQLQYDTAIFIGMIRPSCNVPGLMTEMGFGLCCDPNILIEPDDLLIFIGPKSTPYKPPQMLNIAQGYAKKAQAEMSKFIPASVDDESSKKIKNTLVCGWRPIWSIDPGRLQDRILQVARGCAAGSVLTFLNFVTLENFEKLMADVNIYVATFAGDPCPIKGMEIPTRLYLLGPELGCRGIFVRHIVGDACVAETMEPVISQTDVHTAIVLGTQSSVRLPPRAQDTRVMCIMLLLRKLSEKKMSSGREAVPMHVVGENQEDMTARYALGPKQKGEEHSNAYREPDFVNTQAIYARVLTQTMAYPVIRNAIADLLDDTEGTATIELVPAGNYVPLREHMVIGVVKQMVLLASGERSVFLGYQGVDGELTIAPHHSQSKLFLEGEMFILFRRKLL